MTLRSIALQSQKFVTDNSPTILTAIGVTGTVTTAYLTGKATFKAAKIINEEQFKTNIHNGVQKPLSDKDKFKLVWTLYIPAAGVGTLSCAAIIGANRIGVRRAAAMAAAYSISERAFEEYREKVVEKLGKNKDREVRDDIAQDHVNANPPNTKNVVVTGKGKELFYDKWCGRYFESTMQEVKKAQNDLNYKLLNGGFGYASLNDFYRILGIDTIRDGEDLGWDTTKPLEIMFTTTISDDERPAFVMDFRVAPVREYFRAH